MSNFSEIVMHGLNKIRKQEVHPPDLFGQLQVAEAMYTIQGEGPHAGVPAVFIRLTGCNLRCWFCDTVWNDEEDPYYSPAALAYRVLGLMPEHCGLVVITGGEPLRQDLALFLVALWKHKPTLTVQIETAGTYWQNILYDSRVEVVVSPKTPKIHPLIYQTADAFKYIISIGEVDDEDGLPSMSTQHGIRVEQRLARPRPGALVYLSPCDTGDPKVNQANLETVATLSLKHGYRAGVQLHKLMSLR